MSQTTMIAMLEEAEDVLRRAGCDVTADKVRGVLQAQQAEPRCACGDSFTSDAVCANCLAAQQQAEPVAAQCRFEGEEEWSPCTLAHHLLVQAHPKEWPHYETRALCAQPPAVAVPDGYALVPIEPTPEMVAAGAEGDSQFYDHASFVYRAMLAAAPQGALAASVPAPNDECVHDFVMFRNECMKCGQPYVAAQKGGA